jgi:hypothetical protein
LHSRGLRIAQYKRKSFTEKCHWFNVRFFQDQKEEEEVEKEKRMSEERDMTGRTGAKEDTREWLKCAPKLFKDVTSSV